MRPVVIWLFIAAAAAEFLDEPRAGEEAEIEEPFDQYEHQRSKRDVPIEGPFDEHIRVKRRCGDERHRRSTESLRTPRQVHQYEVHEDTDDHAEALSPSYEEMLAASANHYPHVYVPAPRYLRPDASSANIAQAAKLEPIVSEPVQFVASPQVAASLTAPSHIAIDNPLPVASEPLTQPAQKLADGDLFEAASGHHSKHSGGHGHAHGGGHEKHGHHYGEHGGKSTKGSHSDHWLDKGAKGYKTDELHRKEYEEQDGKRKKFHDNAGHKGSHEEEAFGQRGSHFGQKKGHKKGHKSRGYHNKYHKDELQKEHKFYDDFHKNGEHHRYGKFNARHKSNESGKKKAHHVNGGHDYVESGKKGYSNKGHVDADHKGYHGKHGHDEHHQHHEGHGSKGGKDGGSHWGYSKKH